MEIIKNFFVGLGVLILSVILLVVTLTLFPLIWVASSIILILIKALLLVAFFVGVVILIGYLARKGFNMGEKKEKEKETDKKNSLP